MIDKGIIEIDGKRTVVAKEDIRKLKSILDELSIMYMIDGVSFCSTFRVAGCMENLHDSRMLKSANDGNTLHKSRCTHQAQIQFRKLKIPNFCLLDFISFTQLDNEEAEFLGDLVYGTQS